MKNKPVQVDKTKVHKLLFNAFVGGFTMLSIFYSPYLVLMTIPLAFFMGSYYRAHNLIPGQKRVNLTNLIVRK